MVNVFLTFWTGLHFLPVFNRKKVKNKAKYQNKATIFHVVDFSPKYDNIREYVFFKDKSSSLPLLQCVLDHCIALHW